MGRNQWLKLPKCPGTSTTSANLGQIRQDLCKTCTYRPGKISNSQHDTVCLGKCILPYVPHLGHTLYMTLNMNKYSEEHTCSLYKQICNNTWYLIFRLCVRVTAVMHEDSLLYHWQALSTALDAINKKTGIMMVLEMKNFS